LFIDQIKNAFDKRGKVIYAVVTKRLWLL